MDTFDELRMRRLLEVGRGLVTESDLRVGLDRVLEAAREITGARHAALTEGIDAEAHRAIGEPPGARDRLEAPILVRGQAWGNLYLADRETGPFTDSDAEAVAILADWAAIAIVNADAVAFARSVEAEWLGRSMAIADAERRRFARELHDQTLQGLGGLRMLLASAARHDDPEGTEAALRKVMHEMDHEIDKLRTFIADLRPAALDELGLRPALETLLDRHRGDDLRIVAELDLPDPAQTGSRIDPDLETAVYRIVQEGLTNVVEHARASSARVGVTSDEDGVRIEVEDDGVGFDAAASTAGFGLLGMRERAYLLGGSLEIESRAGRTLVRVQLRARRA
jgi:signal transduction histidine kinase